MLVTDVNFDLKDWANLLSSHGYKIKNSSSGLVVSPCPNCGRGVSTPHFLISQKSGGMTSYNCDLSGTRLVNFFMIQYGLNFLDGKQKMFEYLGIENNNRNNSKKIKEYKERQMKKQRERFIKEEQIKETYKSITSEFRKLRNILNSNHIYFKNKNGINEKYYYNKISEEIIKFNSECIERYYYLDSIIEKILKTTKNIVSDEVVNNIYKFLKNENLIKISKNKIIDEQKEKQEIILNFKKVMINKIKGDL